jgi:hypothetical protein
LSAKSPLTPEANKTLALARVLVELRLNTRGYAPIIRVAQLSVDFMVKFAIKTSQNGRIGAEIQTEI